MLKVEKVDEDNKRPIIDLLKLDVIKHVFAIYDLQYKPEHTTMYVAFENGAMRGCILIYTATRFPSVVLECESDVAGELIKYTPRNGFIIHAPPSFLPTIMMEFPSARYYVEYLMLIKRGQANFFKSELVRKLRVDDAPKIAALFSIREGRPQSQLVDKCADLISRMPTYGVFVNDELVSYAKSFLQPPQVWVIGGVYTHPSYRNRGYATLATSAVTEEALKNAESAMLFVRSDNYPAIRVYEKIGYKKMYEKLWVDVGTGLKP